jgi:hypothetical protein
VLGGKCNQRTEGTLSTMIHPRKCRKVAPGNRKCEATKSEVWAEESKGHVEKLEVFDGECWHHDTKRKKTRKCGHAREKDA